MSWSWAITLTVLVTAISLLYERVKKLETKNKEQENNPPIDHASLREHEGERELDAELREQARERERRLKQGKRSKRRT